MPKSRKQFEAAIEAAGPDKNTHFGKLVLEELESLRRRVDELEGFQALHDERLEKLEE
ncbi:hypothetical protein [Actinoplanes sp. ATCC 53533]|uniref:hypothetical protein n=1 Tax=Actinoplanes sp. ATCC 53533 TaxID=1288362 RepID=UPI001315788E|nr:hypothetical protein [Actinoplanes sp. ATCC 53533]